MSGATQLTYSGIWLAVFARQLCLPVPAVVFLMAAGALAAQGDLHLSLLLLAGVLGCLAGDGVWFWLGRRWGSHVIRGVCSLTLDPRVCVARSRRIFDRWGLRTLMVAKFIPGLDGVTPPLAGAEGASVRGFVLCDSVGSLLWTSAYVSVGYIFSSQTDLVIRTTRQFGTLLLYLVGVPLLLYIAWRFLSLVRVIRQLRLRRISPALLQQKLDANDRVIVLDLLYYEAMEEDIPGIPGAIRVDPVRLRRAPRLKVSDRVDIILYSSSRSEFVSARVAEALGKRGFADVWVLEGGLDAWLAEGRPVTMELSTGEEVAERLGIALPPAQS
jgi:membrane protein DedA with SNARE-associated domain/rhodanese-related sulfurtransferase